MVIDQKSHLSYSVLSSPLIGTRTSVCSPVATNRIAQFRHFIDALVFSPLAFISSVGAHLNQHHCGTLGGDFLTILIEMKPLSG